MSMLDTIGGLAGGLGLSGGVGGSIPSNQSAASSAATATITPSIALGPQSFGAFTLGPFAPAFPGVSTTTSDSINAPTVFGLNSSTFVAVAAIVFLAVIFFVMRK